MRLRDKVYNVVILGSGPAGLTAAIYTARADLIPLVLEGETPGGQLIQTTDVENYPGYPEGILGPNMMDSFKRQAERFGAQVEYGTVTKIELCSHGFKIFVDEEEEIYSRSVIVATGASARWLGLESENRLIGHGVSSCAVCDAAFFRNQEVVVVGGGDTAMEEALFLTKFARKVTIIHRRDCFRASKMMQNRVFKNEKIDIVWNAQVKEILGNQSVCGLCISDINTKEEKKMGHITGVFIAIGHIPNTSLFKGLLSMDKAGFIMVKHPTTVTHIPGLFACGDVIDPKYRQAITAAGSGSKAALDVENYLATLEE